jgi:hypothetical protein
MKLKPDYVPPELQPDIIEEYITGELIYLVDYFADMSWLKVEGILFTVAIVGAVIFKWYRKLDIKPTDKPDTTMGEDLKKLYNSIGAVRLDNFVSKIKDKMKKKDKDE